MKSHWIINRCPLAGSSFTNLFRLLWQNRFKIHFRYLPRLIYVLLMLLITWPLRVLEFLLTTRRVTQHILAHDPVFIIGHWRSGTTLMHYLFHQDSQFATVTNVEVYAPHFCLAFPRLSRFLVNMSLPPTRPMDTIPISADLPGEEEHSLGAIDQYGYFHSMIFPQNYALYSRYESFRNTLNADLKRWQKRYTRFIKKISLKYQNKPLLLKNPANTWRVKHLIRMYPQAKFIHLVRNPYEIMKSSIRFYNETTQVFTLQDWNRSRTLDQMLSSYHDLYQHWEEDTRDVPKRQLIDVKYEDFVKDPLKTVESLYRKLDLTGWKEVKPKMQAYLENHRDYRPKNYTYEKDFLQTVNTSCEKIFQLWGYLQKK